MSDNTDRMTINNQEYEVSKNTFNKVFNFSTYVTLHNFQH